ncbi:MAG: DUF6949 family protein [Rhizomicrobium sp.]
MTILGAHFLREMVVFLFAVTGGLTLSAISANTYRLAATRPRQRAGRLVHYAVMAVAGPSVLFENATRDYRKEACSDFAYLIAVVVVGYWSFLLGMGILSLAPYL